MGKPPGTPLDSEDTAAIACLPAGIDAPVLENTAIGTVARVTWTTPEAVRSRAVYDNGNGVRRATPWDEPATAHEHLAWGILQGAAYELSVEVEAPDGITCSDTVTGQAGALANDTPDVYADTPQVDLVDGGFTVLAAVDGISRWLIVTDESGEVVWSWHIDPSRLGVSQVEHAFLTADGRGIEFAGQAQGEGEPGVIATVGLDGELVSTVVVNGIHTSFVPLPDGGWGALGWEVREFDDGGVPVKLLGDTILEVAADGTSRRVWGSFDEHTPDLSVEWLAGWYLPDPEVGDWSHVNWISYDPAGEDFLVTATFNDGVFRIDRATGAEVWSAGTSDAQVIVPRQEPPLLGRPRSVVATADGLLVFNRNKGSDASLQTCSQAVDLAIVGDDVSAERTYGSESCQLVSFMGDALRLPNDNTLTVFSSVGVVDQSAPDGSLVQRLTVDTETVFGFGQWFEAPQ